MADTWTATIGWLGMPTGDGRIIDPAGFTFRPLPLPLAWQEETDEGHEKSVTIGRIDSIEADPATGRITASGEFLDPDIFDDVAPVMALVGNGIVGPSMDSGRCDVTWVSTGGGEGYYDESGYHAAQPYGEAMMFTAYECAGVTLVSVPAFANVSITLGSGTASTADSMVASVRSSGWGAMPVAPADTAWSGSDAASRVLEWATSGGTVDWGKYAKAFLYRDDAANASTKGAYKLGIADVRDGNLEIIPKGVYAVASVLNGGRGGASIPEAQQAKIKSTVSGVYKHLSKALKDKSIKAPFALVAAATALPRLDAFLDPKLTGPTAPTIRDNGEVFGHIALWETCHVGLPGCVTAPASFSNYAYFATGATLTDGGEIATGKLTIGGGHADGDLGFVAASEHYDNVGTAVATVTTGEDEFGIWFAGALVAGATDEQVEAFRQSPLSGDWRRIGGNLELVAAHAVNVPGFPIPRPRAVVASGGDQLSLVAAGIPARKAVKGPRAADQDAFALSVAEKVAAILASADGPAGPLRPVEAIVPAVDLESGEAVTVVVPDPVMVERERARSRAKLAMMKGR